MIWFFLTISLLLHFIIRPLSVLLLLSACALSANASVDELQLAVDSANTVQLRWDSLQGDGEWLSGEKPEKQQGQYRVNLTAGESLSVIQPADSWLRLVNHGKQNESWINRIQAEQSIDGRLYAVSTIYSSNNKQHALLKPPSQAHIVRLENNSAKAVSLSLYRSRYYLPSPRVLYNDLQALSADAVDLLISPDKGLQRYYELTKSKNLKLKVNGPLRLAIKLRLPMLNISEPKTQTHLDLYLDGELTDSHDLNFQEDYHHTTRLKAKRVVVSEQQTVYINIPEGEHEIGVQSATAAYVQLASLDKLYWSAANLPKTVRWLNKVDTTDSMPEPDMDIVALEKRLLHQVRNNYQSDGVMLALAELDQRLQHNLTEKWSEDQALIKLKNKIKDNYSVFKPLLPVTSGAYQQRWARYIKQRLQFHDRVEPYYLAQKYFKNRLKKIPAQSFHQLGTGKIEYRLLQTNVNSDIQILLYQDDILSEPQQLWLQFDEQAAELITLRRDDDTNKKYHLSVKQAILKHEGCCTTPQVLSAEKAATNIIQVASIQLPAKKAVKSLKIWANKPGTTLWLALQQRQGTIYKFSQAQYLFQLQQKDTFKQFVKALKAYVSKPGEAVEINPDSLENHWLPILKQLNTAYHNRVENISTFDSAHATKLSDSEALSIKSAAMQAEQSDEWLRALELWSQLWTEPHSLQQIALQHMVKNLQHNSQHALARQLQLSIIFSSADTGLSAELVKAQLELLVSGYREQNNDDALVALLSAFFVHQPNETNLQRLGSALVKQGRWRQGLELLLLLPESARPHNDVLISALQTGWLMVFDQQLIAAGLSSAEHKKWQGLKSLFDGDYSRAKYLFSQIDSNDDEVLYQQVNVWLEIIEESQKIQSLLLSADTDQRKDALKQWQVLQLKINSRLRTRWVSEQLSVVSHGGQFNLTQTRTQVSLMHYLSRPQQPLELQVAGPAHLRLQLRPLHTVSGTKVAPLNSLYTISDGDKKHNFLINHNLPSEHWIVSELDNVGRIVQIPGQRITQEVVLGEGIHKLYISGENDLLIRVQRKTPALPVSVLPELTQQNMQVVLRGDAGNSANSNTSIVSDKIDDEWLSDDMHSDESVSQQQLKQILFQLEERATGYADSNARNIMQNKLISWAEKIYAGYDNSSELAGTMSRIRKYSRWSLLNSVASSDGFWVQRFSGWQAESPQSRLYQALLPDYGVAHDLLRNGSSQIVSLFNPRASQLEIHVRAVSPRFIRTQNVLVSFQLDNEKTLAQIITPQDEKISIAVPRGRHNVKISLLQAALHHRLWLSLNEQDGQSVSLKKSRRYYLAGSEQSLDYQVQGPAWLRIDKYINGATESKYRYFSAGQQRLTLSVGENEKSAYYRVFKRQLNQAVLPVQYYSWSAHNLPAQNLLNEQKTNDYKVLSDTPAIKKQSELRIENQPVYSLKDGWNLGRQQSGTSSLLITSVDQNLIIDELAVSTDKYLEAELAYRKFQPVSERWFYLAGIARYRQPGNPTLGVKSRLRGEFDFVPVNWTLDGRAYTQTLETGNEWSAQLQLRLGQTRWLGTRFYHLPRTDVFARWLSTDTDFGNTNVDRDVFSDYKSDHRSGIRLSETLVYRPYQDMEFYTGVSFISNSYWLELDQYRSKVGARVQWGRVRWDINARNIEFQADSNRAQDNSRSVIQARVLVEKWFSQRYRYELAAAIDHDVDSGDDTLRVQLSVHQSEGRGYRDYSPAETLFRDVRQTGLIPELNNEFN